MVEKKEVVVNFKSEDLEYIESIPGFIDWWVYINERIDETEWGMIETDHAIIKFRCVGSWAGTKYEEDAVISVVYGINYTYGDEIND